MRVNGEWAFHPRPQYTSSRPGMAEYCCAPDSRPLEQYWLDESPLEVRPVPKSTRLPSSGSAESLSSAFPPWQKAYECVRASALHVVALSLDRGFDPVGNRLPLAAAPGTRGFSLVDLATQIGLDHRPRNSLTTARTRPGTDRLATGGHRTVTSLVVHSGKERPESGPVTEACKVSFF